MTRQLQRPTGRPPWRPLAGAGLLAALSLTLVCTAVEASERIESGRRLPAIPLVTLAGEDTELDALRGEGPALVVFWATWCEPCRREVPALNELAAAGSERGLELIGIAMAEPLGLVSTASSKLEMDYRVAVAPDAAALARAGVDRVPLLVLLDAEGRVASIAGHVDASLRNEVERLLAGGRSAGGSGLAAALMVKRAPFPFAEVVLASDFWKSAWLWLPVPFLSILFFYSIIIIHCCSHDDLTPWRRVNTVLGEILSIPNLFLFREFTALHVMHHAFTNDKVRDPHWVRPGESWLHYVVTQYPRLVAFTFTEDYRKRCWAKHWKDVDFESSELKRHDRIAKLFGSSGRLRHSLWVLPFASIFGGLMPWFVLGTLLWGLPVLALLFAWWLLPWAIGQVIVADFNWRGHVGLAARQEIPNKDYVGQDTRSYYRGIWRLVNTLTFGFYLHREHHVVPRVCFGMKQDAEIAAAQEAEEASTPLSRLA